METRVTIIKSYRHRNTLRLMELGTLAATIRSCEYQEQVNTLRQY